MVLRDRGRRLFFLPPAVRGFFGMPGSRPWLVLAGLFLASTAEGLGIASLLPALALAIGDGGGAELPPAFREALSATGLEPDLGSVLAFVAAALVLKAALMILIHRMVAASAARVTARMRERLMAALFAARWTWFVRHSIGRVANAVIGEAGVLGQLYTLTASFFVFVINAAVYLGVAALVSWKIALAALLLGSLMAAVLFGFVSRARRFGDRQIRRSRDTAILLANVVSNIKTIKAMGRESVFLGYLAERVRQLRRTSRKQDADRQALASLQETLLGLVLVAMFYGLHSWGGVPVPELVVSALLLGRTISAMNKAQKAWQEVARVQPAIGHVEDFLAETERMRESPGGTRQPTLAAGIRFEKVGFAYGGVPVFEALDAEIPAGRTTVLVGPSGTGKTTFVDLVLGLLEPVSGRILVDGVPLSEIDLQAWRRMIGYVPQDQVLLNASLRDNLTLGDPAIDEAAIRRALELAEAAEFVAALPEGLDTHVGERGMRFSGGQRQRLALARALAGRPQLLVLDEVTSALDEETERRICRNLATMPDRPTILAVTHRPAWVGIADHVVDMAMRPAVRSDPHSGSEAGGPSGLNAHRHPAHASSP